MIATRHQTLGCLAACHSLVTLPVMILTLEFKELRLRQASLVQGYIVKMWWKRLSTQVP